MSEGVVVYEVEVVVFKLLVAILLPKEVDVVIGVVRVYTLISFLTGSVGFFMSITGLLMIRDRLSVFSLVLGFPFGLIFYYIF